jgi:hypothetical protein
MKAVEGEFISKPSGDHSTQPQLFRDICRKISGKRIEKKWRTWLVDWRCGPCVLCV